MSLSEEILSVSDPESTSMPVRTIRLRNLLVIISSWKKRVEKGNKGIRHDENYNDGTTDDANVATSNTNLRSTGKSAKKRRAAVVVEEDAHGEESDDEDD